MIMRNGAELIASERYRQIKEEGYSHAADNREDVMNFILAAEAYINSAEGFAVPQGVQIWPWEDKYFKPRQMKQDLIRAGALIAAALDRLNYAYFADGPKISYHYEAGSLLVQAVLLEWRSDGLFPFRTRMSDYFHTKYEAITDLYRDMESKFSYRTSLAKEEKLDFEVVKEEYLRLQALNPYFIIPINNKGYVERKFMNSNEGKSDK